MRKADSRVNMAKALEKSLNMLGEPSKKTLLFHLTHTFKIPIERKNCSIEEIEGALKQILGEGASLVVALINKELRQETR
jgi:hypothetical protein